jgi:hypothetical protein
MIKPPNWCANAIPGKNGWEDPDTGEVYASARFTDAQISEFYGYPSEVAEVVITQQEIADHAEIYNETIEGKWDAAEASMSTAPIPHVEIDNMTKVELEALGREHGVELDRRKTKAVLAETMKEILSK